MRAPDLDLIIDHGDIGLRDHTLSSIFLTVKGAQGRFAERHLGQLSTVLLYRAQKPCDVEAPRQVHQVGAPSHQNDTPSQIASGSSLVINSGRGVLVDCTTTLSSPTFPSRRKLPSLSTASKGVVARRAQFVFS